MATTVLAVGWLLGGTVGVGTLAYAFGIGPPVVEAPITTMGGCPSPQQVEKIEKIQPTPTC